MVQPLQCVCNFAFIDHGGGGVMNEICSLSFDNNFQSLAKPKAQMTLIIDMKNFKFYFL